MTLHEEKDALDFLEEDSWCCETMKEIMERHPEAKDAFNQHCEEVFPNGATPTELNDYLRFEWESVCDSCGIEVDEDGNDITEEDEEDEEG